jgi:anti-sigma factor ChrR (cupin superfamily)
MTDRAATHDMSEVAVLYALGALSQHEARSFEEHLAEGCEACRAELEPFESTVRALGFSAPDAEPPSRARAELVARITASTTEQTGESGQRVDNGQFVSIRSSEGRWRELMKGVLLKKLHLDPATGIATSLVRMMPGTALPIHQHTGVEQFYVIEGDCQVAGQLLRSGDYHRAEAGSTHETTSTVEGTLLLLIAPERYEVLDAR